MTWTNEIWLALGVGFAVALLLTPIARRLGLGVSLIDVPNERSSHFVPTPRTGGIAILLGVLGALASSGILSNTAGIIICAFVLGAVSLYDDLRPLPHHFRLVAQIVIGTVGVLLIQPATQSIDLPLVGNVGIGFLAIPILVFWVVGVTNAFNFMDGINGIASLEALICAATLGILMSRGGDASGAVFAAAIAGAALGFLLWNLGGSIFMGDVGSAGLGFLLSLLVIRASRSAYGVAAMLPLFPFLFDSALTLVRRAMHGEKWFSTPHRTHFYQRLVSSGLSHVTVSLTYAFLALISSALALAYGELSDTARVIGIVVLLLVHLTIVPVTTMLESRLTSPQPSTTK